MIGKLIRAEKGWVVRYEKEIPLHPEQDLSEIINNLDYGIPISDFENKIAEFDIVIVGDKDDLIGKKYAKLSLIDIRENIGESYQSIENK